MFGDISTDLGAVLQGGMGMAGSANIGDHHAMFEPVHGSSAQHAGKGIVNPIASISSVQMMLDWLGRRNANDDLVEVAELVGTAIADHVRERQAADLRPWRQRVHHGRGLEHRRPALPMPSESAEASGKPACKWARSHPAGGLQTRIVVPCCVRSRML